MDFDPHALPVPDLGIRCLQCGYPLTGLPSHRCPECGRTFDLDEYIPRGEFPFVIFNGGEVVLDKTTAEIMRRAGILYIVNQMPMQAAFAITSIDAHEGKLAVERGRYFEAIHWLKHHEKTGQLPPEPVISNEVWHCPKCNEENPGNFDLCWNCNAERSPLNK